MRSLLGGSMIVALLAASMVAQPAMAAQLEAAPAQGWVPNVIATRSSPVPFEGTNRGCYGTSAPLVVTPSNIFQGMVCQDAELWGNDASGDPKEMCTMWHYDSTIKNGGSWTLKFAELADWSLGHQNCFPETPTLAFRSIRQVNIVATTATRDETTKQIQTWVIGMDSSRTTKEKSKGHPEPNWIINTDGVLSGIAGPTNSTVFYSRGKHDDPNKPGDTVTSVEAVNVMSGKSMWSFSYFQDTNISKPVYYEDNVYFLAGQYLHKIDSATGTLKAGGTATYPCNFESVQNMNIALVEFGFERKSVEQITTLSAMFIYGNTRRKGQPKSAIQFHFCRIHHGSYMFGESHGIDWSRQNMNLTVNGISGGDNATFVSFKENAEVAVWNCSNTGWTADDEKKYPGRLVANFTRQMSDATNQPYVLYQSTPYDLQTKPPLVVLSTEGGTATWDTWAKAPGWKLNIGCPYASKPSYGAPYTIFCAGGTWTQSNKNVIDQGAARINYDGEIVWQGGIPNAFQHPAAFPPVAAGNVEIYYTDLQGGIIGVDFDGRVGSGNEGPDNGGDGGVIILTIFLVIFALVALAGIARFVFNSRRNRFTALQKNAVTQGNTTSSLSARSMSDVEEGQAGAAKSGGGAAGYGGLNE